MSHDVKSSLATLAMAVAFAACASSSAPGETGNNADGGIQPDAGQQGAAVDAQVEAAGEPAAGDAQGDVAVTPVAWVTNPASHVNTLVGTTGGGNVFPGADYPFGMIQCSPDTLPDRNVGGGYEYTDSQILGFSLTHISGPGCAAYGDVPILPMTGGLPSGDPTAYTVPFSHANEVATAGYYSVQTGSPAVTTEITATLHSAMARFTFPATNDANLLFKLVDSQNGSSASSATIVGTNEVQGSTTSGHFCGAGDVYTVYFDIVFDQPFTAQQVITPSGKTTPSFVFLTFDTTTTQVLQAKVAISFVSVDNARGNWTADNPNPTWDFDNVHAAATAAWNKTLGQIQIAGGTTSEQELFYTSLYHSLLHPNVFSDTNGQYMGFDNAVHTVSGSQKDQYANYSGWDIYHCQVQLSAIVAPDAMSDSAQSMLNDAAQNGGMLPKWGLANGETYIMVGDPADGIIAGYYAFGAKTFDTATALKVMLAEANTPSNIRPGLQDYETMGYLPDDATYGCCNFYGSLATLLEYGQADYALSQFATALGDTTDAAALLKRAQSWQNVLDPSTNLFTPKLLDGTFVSGVGLTSGQGMVEGSASQYHWIIAYARQAELAAMGGATVVNPLLDAFFSNLDDSSGNGALMSNEFELGAQYWQNDTGEPWKTQDIVNRLRTQLYTDAPKLIDNNDDLGALSSQLVWSMLGIFPDYPGSAMLAVNGPEFTDELIHLPGGASLILHAPQASPSNPYIQSMQLNGQATTNLSLDPSLIQSGGTLDFDMSSVANTGAPPGSLGPYFNNVGMSDDSNGSAGNFDGGGHSYSVEALAAGGATAGGTLSVGGITYHWPNEAAGTPDNIEVSGQTISAAANTGKTTLGLLGSASSAGASGATGTVTVTYADNTTQSVPVVFTDWTRGGGTFAAAAGDTVAVTAAYRNAGDSQDATPCYVFAFTAALTSTQSVTSVTLPTSTSGGDIHIFDIELN
jgi:predicted alpha-1,2-mannosidase